MAPPRQRQAGSLLFVVGLALTATLSAWGLQRLVSDPTGHHQEGPQRVVSLSPALTETLFAIGAGEQVVGVSEYTESPAAATRLPRAGTAITPDYEQLVSLRPTLLVAPSAADARLPQLRAVAPTRILPWLSVEDVATGTRELGRWTGHEREAEQLAHRLEERLARKPGPDAPRVLLLLGYAGNPGGQLWFVRRNSIHGRALAAAGARHAIDEDIMGPPTLSLERLVQVDPDSIVVLAEQDGEGTIQRLQRLRQLRAVERDRLIAINDPGLLIPGPRIIDLIDILEARLDVDEESP